MPFGLRNKKEEPKSTEKIVTPDELKSFETAVYAKIPEQPIRDLVSSFIIRPSWFKEYDPQKKLEQAEQSEKNGRIGDARLEFRAAAFAAFYQKSKLTEICWKAYEDFLNRKKDICLGKSKDADWYFKDIKDYRELKQKPYIMDILTTTFEEFTKTLPEAGKR